MEYIVDIDQNGVMTLPGEVWADLGYAKRVRLRLVKGGALIEPIKG